MAVASVTTDQILQAYRDTLGRTPGPEEVDFWVNYSTTNDPTQTANAFLAGAQDELASRQSINIPAATSSDLVLNLPTRTTIPAPVDVSSLAATGPVRPVPQPSVTSDQIVESYTKYLNRTPSAEEITFWTDYSKTNDPTQTAEAFLAGAKNEIANVTKSGYESYLGRTPNQEELNFWTNYTVEQGAPQAAAAWRAGADQELAARNVPSSVTEQQILDSYNKFFNRTPSADEVSFWVNYGRTADPTQTANAFINSARKEIGDITKSGYESYLGREPTQQELDFWTNYTIENDAVQAANAWKAGADEELSRRKAAVDVDTTLQNSNLTGSLVSESTAGIPYAGGIYKRTPQEEVMYLKELSRIPVNAAVPLPVMPMSLGPSDALTRARQPGDIGEGAYYAAIRDVVTSGDYTPAQLRQMQRNVGTSGQDINVAFGRGMTPITTTTPTMPGATTGTTQSIDQFIQSKAPTTSVAMPTAPSMFSPENVRAQLELERLRLQPTPEPPPEEPVAGFAQGGLVSDDINRMLQNQRNAIQRESQSRQMLTNLGAPPVKKFSDGGPAGSSSGVRRLKMSGYQGGGEVNENPYVRMAREERAAQDKAFDSVNRQLSDLLERYKEGNEGITEKDLLPFFPGYNEYDIAQMYGTTTESSVPSMSSKARSFTPEIMSNLRKHDELMQKDFDRLVKEKRLPRDVITARTLGLAKGGEITNDEFIQEMFTGTRPEDFPETSSVDKKAGELLRALSEGTRGFVGAEPIEAGSEAYRTGQALANMPAVGVVAATAKGAGKSVDQAKALMERMTPELEKFLKDSVVKERLYRGQRRAPAEEGFALTQGRGTPSFTTDTEVANVYSRQLGFGNPEYGPGSTVVPAYVQMKNPLDIRDLGEYIDLESFVNRLPNVDLDKPTVKNGFGYEDIAKMVRGIGSVASKTGAKYEIEASSPGSIFRVTEFDELADAIEELGGAGKSEKIQEMLFDTSIDAFLIGDSKNVKNALKEKGFDGVIHKDAFDVGGQYYQGDPKNLEGGTYAEYIHDSYRPFFQEKIKSAIGNVGTYDTTKKAITKAEGGEVTNDEFIQQVMTGTPMSDTSTRPGILPPELREAIDVPLDFANLLIRGTAAVPIGGVAGLYKGITGGKYGTQEGVKEADTEAARMMAEITGEPKTQTAKDVLQSIGDTMQKYKLDAAMPQLLTLPSPGAGTTEFIKQAVRSEFEAPPVGAVTLKPDASTDLETAAPSAGGASIRPEQLDQLTSQTVIRGQDIPPLTKTPTPEEIRVAKADTRMGQNIVADRLNIIVPETERVRGGIYRAGQPSGRPWSELTPEQLKQRDSGFKGTDNDLDKMWQETLSEVSEAGRIAVERTGATWKAFPAKNWDNAFKLPLRNQLWYELSGEAFVDRMPDTTTREMLTFLDLIGATSARAKPLENLERSVAISAQKLQGVPVDVDVTIPSTVKDALRREGTNISSDLANKTGNFSDTLALTGGLPVRYPISVNDVWVGNAFGITDQQLGANQALHEVFARYMNKVRDFHNETGNPLYPHESWQVQARQWVEMRANALGIDTSKLDTVEGSDYAAEFDKVVKKLENAGISVPDGILTRDVLLDPRIPDALRTTTKAFREAPKATVEFGTLLTPSGKRGAELFKAAKAVGDELTQKEYLKVLTSSMYDSARGKPTPWQNLVRVATNRAESVTRIYSPTSQDPFAISGTFQGAAGPNIRIPFRDMTPDQIAYANAVAGSGLKQKAMAAAEIRRLELNDPIPKGYVQTNSIKFDIDGPVPESLLVDITKELGEGFEVSAMRYPDGLMVDINPRFGDAGPEAATVEAIDRATDMLEERYKAKGVKAFRSAYRSEFGKNYVEDPGTGTEYNRIIQETLKGWNDEAITRITDLAGKSVKRSDISKFLAGKLDALPIDASKLPEGTKADGVRGRTQTIRKQLRQRISDHNESVKAFESIGQSVDGAMAKAIPTWEKRAQSQRKKLTTASTAQPVAPEIGINVASDIKAGAKYADLIVDGQKTLESRDTDSLRPYVGKRVAIVRTGEGQAKAIGAATIGEPILVDAKKFRELQNQHLVPEGSKFDIKGGNKYLYPIIDPERFGTEQEVGKGIVARRVRGKGTTSAAEDLAAVSPTAPAVSRVEKTKIKKAKGGEVSITDFIKRAA
jgi:hypothetical protein